MSYLTSCTQQKGTRDFLPLPSYPAEPSPTAPPHSTAMFVNLLPGQASRRENMRGTTWPSDVLPYRSAARTCTALPRGTSDTRVHGIFVTKRYERTGVPNKATCFQ